MVKENTMRQTEIGSLPEDWEVVAIGDISNVDSENLTSNTSKDYEFKYISLEYVDEGKLTNFQEIKFRNAPSRARRILRNGDLLFSTVRPNLKSHLFFESHLSDFICSTGFAVVRSRLCSKYIYYNFFSNALNQQVENLIVGSNYPAINSKDVKNLKIPLPPLPEQEAIAEALSDADAWIESLEQLIAKKHLIKQGAMQELLSPKEDWEVKKLGEFNFDISDGNYSAKYPKSSEFRDNGIPFIRAVNIKNYKVVNKDLRYISPELHNELLKGHLKKGDILITNRGDIGQLAFVGDDFIGANINAQIVRINTNQDLNHKYLLYWLSTDYSQNKINDLQTGSALKQLPINNLKKIQIKYPSLTEQTRIATILWDMDAELEALEAQLAKAWQVKQGMMQELLTGRVRLV